MTMINPPHKGSDAMKREMAKEDKEENGEPEEKGCGSNKATYPKHEDQKSVLSGIGILQTRPWDSSSADWFNAYREQQDKLLQYRKEMKKG